MDTAFEVTNVGIIINNTNYGNLVSVALPNGAVVVIDSFYLDMVFGSTEITTVPFDGKIYIPLAMSIEVGSSGRTIMAWSGSKEGLHDAAVYLSTLGKELTITGHARILGRYIAGREVIERRTLDHFYTDVDAAMVEETTW